MFAKNDIGLIYITKDSVFMSQCGKNYFTRTKTLYNILNSSKKYSPESIFLKNSKDLRKWYISTKDSITILSKDASHNAVFPIQIFDTSAKIQYDLSLYGCAKNKYMQRKIVTCPLSAIPVLQSKNIKYEYYKLTKKVYFIPVNIYAKN